MPEDEQRENKQGVELASVLPELPADLRKHTEILKQKLDAFKFGFPSPTKATDTENEKIAPVMAKESEETVIEKLSKEMEKIEAFIEKLPKEMEKDDSPQSAFFRLYADQNYAEKIRSMFKEEERQKIIYMCFVCDQMRKENEKITPIPFRPVSYPPAMMYLEPLFNIIQTSSIDVGILSENKKLKDDLSNFEHQNKICTDLYKQCVQCEQTLQQSLDKKYPEMATQPEKIYPKEEDVEAKQLSEQLVVVRKLKETFEDTTKSPSARIESFQTQGNHPDVKKTLLNMIQTSSADVGISPENKKLMNDLVRDFEHQNKTCTQLREQCETYEWKLQKSLDKKYPEIATQPVKVYHEGDVESKQLKAVRELKKTLEETATAPSTRIKSFQNKCDSPETKRTLQGIEGGAFWRTIRAILERLIPLEFFKSTGKKFMQEVEKTTAAMKESREIII